MADSKYVQKIYPWMLRMGERRAILVFGDLLVALAALGLAIFYWGTRVRFLDFNLQFLWERVPWFYLLPLFWLVLLVELYDVHKAGEWRQTVKGIMLSALAGLGLYLVYYFLYNDPARPDLPRLGVGIFLTAAALLTLAWRGLYIRIFTAPQFLRRALLVGGGRTGQILLRIVNNLNPRPFNLVGIIDDDPRKLGAEIEGAAVIGTSEQLLTLAAERNISDVIVAISGEMQGCMFQALLDTQERGVEISRMPVVYEELLGRVPIRLLETDWILRSFVDQARVSAFYEVWKRLLDIAGGLVGTLLLFLAFPFFAVAILIEDGRPIFYGQTRSGRGGEPYRILKFRSMRNDAEADGQAKWAKEDDERATRVGRLLRKSHLDELPQFLNVLRGEMSLVGPRAERPELVDLFQKHVPFYRARLMVKPGMTGWAQINLPYAATIDETITKLEYDLYYIKHRNILMDLMIMLRTPSTVFGFRGR